MRGRDDCGDVIVARSFQGRGGGTDSVPQPPERDRDRDRDRETETEIHREIQTQKHTHARTRARARAHTHTQRGVERPDGLPPDRRRRLGSGARPTRMDDSHDSDGRPE